MNKYLPLRASALLLAALSLALPARAQPAAFDYYLLSMSIEPSFCALDPAHRSKPDCRTLTQASYVQTPLTIHGLWPNRANVSVDQQPHDCSNTPLVLSPAVKADLALYMPGGPPLQQHEWSKHGTCSGLTPDAYFAAAVALAKQVNDTVGSVMRQQGMLTGQVAAASLIQGVAAKDPALAAVLEMDCQRPVGKAGKHSGALLAEIRFRIGKDFKPLPGSAGGQQSSGCPGGTGTIPAVH